MSNRTPAGGSRQLTLRLSAEDDQQVEWLIAASSPFGPLTQGVGTWDALRAELVRYPVSSTRVLAPATTMAFHTVTLPRRTQRHWRQAIPFMLEEQLASDIEQLHFAVVARQAERFTVAVMHKSLMARWTAQCQSMGVHIDALMPDVLALPLAEEGWSAVLHHRTWLFRTAAGTGMAAEEGWYQMLLESADVLPAIHSYSPLPAGVENWRALPEASLMTLAANAPVTPGVDLRQGDFAVGEPWRNAIAPWRGVIAAAGLYLLTLMGGSLWEHYQLYRQAAVWREESVRIYRELFPDDKHVVNPRAQMQQHLQAAGSGNPAASLTAHVGRLQQLAAKHDGLQLVTLGYDRRRGELRLQLRAASFVQMEQFRQQASAYYDIPPGEMKQERDHTEGQLVLRSRL
ncbi:type II secretion system protein GspL [Lonsdalea populi]|uniref:type II secretion system protein GspL n=1 Tax=Lonsdalea populi TaxID=1172565 RepID=UPI000A223DCF|nr:type II secretion system protein GspL [Lonsdalea populi]OSM98961.1 type II secretion system protein GspL [Lonsdalea populi]RAT72633.1 type II secretion system protein GspL [Lonsdalea populi]RAT73734.1 type II secretion system protein GspL [Lonsdalea populi]RAT77451.1 type II secretion system protein GspL [Lonsdalea populi]RAT79684.1 type II secretion system protein GspL [Lonsdalea populi]